MNSITGPLNAASEYFMDPISYKRMEDPVMNFCGHTFEKHQINGWIERCVKESKNASCPLCQAPITGLIPNRQIQQALDILNDPANARASIESLLDEEKEHMEITITLIRARRDTDLAKGIPHKIPQPETFTNKMVSSVQAYYKTCY